MFPLEDELLENILRDKNHKVVHVEVEKPQEPPLGSAVEEMPINDRLKKVLVDRGIKRLYKFQEEAVLSILEGNHTLILAGTGTGKTEAFLIPILNDIIRNPFAGTRALLIYPTKALARDQLSRINELTKSFFGVRTGVFDGDTSQSERKKIFSMPPALLLTNPDMIHVSLMYSEDFKWLLKKVKYVVLDDMHVYNGVFGTHVAYVIKRLSRFLSRDVVFIGSSATIGNPEDYSKQFFGKEMNVVRASGGRRGYLIHVMVRPVARSKLIESIALLRKCLEHDLKTLVFADSHRMVELVKRLAERYGLNVAVHRAGLRPEERERIEKLFKEGKIRAVAATPTLELGIDIGDLDCIVLLNIPPTFSKYVQRTGRCGRRGQKGYIFLILGDDPISQYYENNPHDFFVREYEPLYIDLTNDEIAKIQLTAMAIDMPIKIGELDELKKMADVVIRKGFLRKYGKFLKATRLGRKYVREHMNLRGVGEIVKIYDERGKLLGFREMPMALKELFPGAVYLHGGNVYLSLEFTGRKAVVRKLPRDFDLTTTPLFYSEPSNFKEIYSGKIYGISVKYGSLTVREVVYGYVVKDFKKNVVLKEEILDKEFEYSFNTKGLLLEFPINEEWNMIQNAEAFHAIEHVLISAGETIVGASPTDMGGISFPSGHIFIYDSFPGGSGVTKMLFQRLEKVFIRAYKIISKCSCVDGCPRCIFSPYCGNNNKILSRRKALIVMENILFKRHKIPIVYIPMEGKPIV